MPGLEMKYFVLKPKGDDIYAEASRSAMRIYASTIQALNPGLAHDLMSWVSREEMITNEFPTALCGV
jgi:hypothetical protein